MSKKVTPPTMAEVWKSIPNRQGRGLRALDRMCTTIREYILAHPASWRKTNKGKWWINLRWFLANIQANKGGYTPYGLCAVSMVREAMESK
jgi:hypothetical protein